MTKTQVNILMAILFSILLFMCANPVIAGETCVTSTFAGVTTTRCKEGGEVTSVCKSREFGGKIYTECK